MEKLTKIPYVIAEAGVNHEGSIKTAKLQIQQAAEAGASAIKFQMYQAETIASRNSPSYWDTDKEEISSQYELFKKHDSFWKKEYSILAEECSKSDIDFLCTPFCEESAVFLNDLVKYHKVSSSDITNKLLLRKIATMGKPVILSTGASNVFEIRRAVEWLGNCENFEITLLHCVLNYPTMNSQAEIGKIMDLKNTFLQCSVGYSDHTLPGKMEACILAAMYGAAVIEKHFTHDKNLKGNDHYHAMDKNDLKLFLNALKTYVELTGSGELSDVSNQTLARTNARRSLALGRAMPKDSIITEADLIPLRPGTGISPADIEFVIDKRLKKPMEKYEVLNFENLY